MQVRVRVPDGDGDETRALHGWLAAEPEVRAHGRPAPASAAPARGEMGTAIDAISLIVGSGLSLGQLLVAIAAWRATRPRPYRVTVELPDRVIAVETDDADEALEIARRLETD